MPRRRKNGSAGKKRNYPANRKSVHREPNWWQRSAQWKRIASEALRHFHAVTKKDLPRCGAYARTTGEPCQQIALENGRCHWHGGASPSGRDQGTRQFRVKKSRKPRKTDLRKVEAKMARWGREDKDRRRRLVLMSDDDFRVFFKSTHAHHDRAFRQIVDAELQRRGLTRSDIMGGPSAPLRAEPAPRPPNPELEALEAQIRALEARKAELENPGGNGAPGDAGEEPEFPQVGVFG